MRKLKTAEAFLLRSHSSCLNKILDGDTVYFAQFVSPLYWLHDIARNLDDFARKPPMPYIMDRPPSYPYRSHSPGRPLFGLNRLLFNAADRRNTLKVRPGSEGGRRVRFLHLRRRREEKVVRVKGRLNLACMAQDLPVLGFITTAMPPLPEQAWTAFLSSFSRCIEYFYGEQG